MMDRREFASRLLALFVLMTMMTGCTRGNSARGVVDRFIEARYILIDQKQMQELTTGLALDKIHDEIKLTQGQNIDQSTRKPVVHYALEKTRTEGDKTTFLFKARIDVPEGGTFKKFWMITAKKDGEVWKVSNYSEYD